MLVQIRRVKIWWEQIITFKQSQFFYTSDFNFYVNKFFLNVVRKTKFIIASTNQNWRRNLKCSKFIIIRRNRIFSGVSCLKQWYTQKRKIDSKVILNLYLIYNIYTALTIPLSRQYLSWYKIRIITCIQGDSKWDSQRKNSDQWSNSKQKISLSCFKILNIFRVNLTTLQ